MSDDLIGDLLVAELLAEGNSPNAAKLYRAAREEIERCHERLEIDHVFRMSAQGEKLDKVSVPYAERLTMPDGIECRDATISLLEYVPHETTDLQSQ